MSETEKKSPLDELIRHLTDYEQIDDEGILVIVSRQACDEAAEVLRHLKQSHEKTNATARMLGIELEDHDDCDCSACCPN